MPSRAQTEYVPLKPIRDRAPNQSAVELRRSARSGSLDYEPPPTLQGEAANPKHHRSVGGQRGRSPGARARPRRPDLFPMAGRGQARSEQGRREARRVQPKSGDRDGGPRGNRVVGLSRSGGACSPFFLCIDRESSANLC
jgi:hypothetical protein